MFNIVLVWGASRSKALPWNALHLRIRRVPACLTSLRRPLQLHDGVIQRHLAGESIFCLFVLTALFAVLQRRENRIESACPKSNQGVVDEETDSRFQT